MIPSVAGKGDKPSGQLVLKEYDIISGINSAQTLLHCGDQSIETELLAASMLPCNTKDIDSKF